MADVTYEWAGKERLFRLNFGSVLDLEEALGKVAIGEVFMRLTGGRFYASDVWHIIRLALIAGGETHVEAKRLMEKHFDTRPYTENAALAGEIMMALMTGVEVSDEPVAEGGELLPFKFSEVSQISRTFALSPQDVRDMRYSDFLNMIKGFNASSKQKAEPPTEEEFDAILAKYEPEALK